MIAGREGIGLQVRVVLPAISILVVAIAVLVTTGAVRLYDEVNTTNLQAWQKRANALAKASELPLSVQDVSTLESLAQGVLAEPDADWVRVFDGDSQLVAEFGAANENTCSTIQSMVAQPQDLFGLDELGDSEESVAVVVETIGYIEIGFSRELVDRRLAAQLKAFIAAGFAGAVVSGGLLWSLLGGAVRRIQKLVRSSEQIARGDLKHPIEDRSSDEVGRLADAMDAMRLAVSDREDALAEMNETLASQVEARTRDLTNALEEARAASLAKSDFLANMSHEIRTPMTAILGYADLLGEESEIATSPERAAEAVRTIRSNADHLLSIVNDILDVSKIESGRMTSETVESDVAGLLRDVVELVRPRAEGKNLAVELYFETTVPRQIQTDPTRLKQIVLNVLGNAIKFTETGSVKLLVSCNPEASLLTMRVQDTGIGMSPEQVEKIVRFDAFTQADSSMARRFGGSGLGLRISNALTQMLGGEIKIESEQGVGSTFIISIGTGDLDGVEMVDGAVAIQEPIAGTTAATVPTQADAKALLGMRILFAEDGLDNQRLIGFHLRKAGADLTLCDNGQIAVDTVARMDRLPDLILMDMQMPELDGYSATTHLRKQGIEVPIIALTAHAMEGDRERCLNAGCDDYLTKPINKKLLIETCLRWAGRDADQRAA